VISVGRRTGRAERDEHVLGVETSELEVRLRRDDGRTREQLFSDVRERLEAVPGARFNVGQPISHRIEHMISGQRSALSIKLVGDDLGELRRVARRAEAIARSIDGLVDVNMEQIVEIPQLVVHADPVRAGSYGFSTGEAARAISLALWGTTRAQVFEQGTVTDVVVKYPPIHRDDLAALRSLRIPTPSGALVPIEALADLRQDTGPNYILRENVRRRVVVTANLADADMSSVHGRLKQRLDAQLNLPEGVHLQLAGQFERERAVTGTLTVFGLLSVLGIALIVASTLGSVRRALIVLANLPLALAGGAAGVHLSGGTLSVATTIGFITLFGIATRNGLLLATRARDLEGEGLDWREAVARGAQERLSPILMTALTAALGLLPLGLSLGQPGSEIQAPMALVILTGLITSTALNMLVVPTLLARWGKQPG
jgi:Cu/Ag efflux pump CusA